MTETTNKPTPGTDEEYAIHALTIHGAFFERKCQDIIHQTTDWKLRETNYPVEHNGAASELDIWAEKKEFAYRLFLPIECKKNNPEFVDWIFFPRADHRPSNTHFQSIQVRNRIETFGKWGIQQQLLWVTHDLIVADEARETKGNYLLIKNKQDRTKTQNNSIAEAARQIAIASQSLLHREVQIIGQMADYNMTNHIKEPPPYYTVLCFPVIVTTANLYACKFQEADIDLTTGEIPFDKAKFTPVPYLLFNFPVPVTLQTSTDVTNRNYEGYWEARQSVSRMPIFVVQSKAFPTFLERLQLPEEHEDLFHPNWYSMQLDPGTVTL